MTWFSDFHDSVILPYILTFGIFSYFFQIMNENDQTFDLKVLIGRSDLILQFSNFCLISRHSFGM